MPAPRGVKRTASKTSAVTVASSAPKNKKKRGVTHLEIPIRPVKRGSVLTCGQGDVGQLGLGEDVMELTKFKLVPELNDKIVSICAGGMHTVALDKDGTVWTFGCNDEGALGRAGEEARPGAVTLPARAAALAAGDSHSAALLDDGRLYAWGSFRDSHGSMGLIMSGGAGKPCPAPVLVDVGEPIAHIASGSDHLVMCTISGAVYTAGCGEQGQLGRLSQRSASREARQGFSALLTPARVTLRGGAVRVWAGYHASVALSEGKLLAWGLNNYSQLGITGEKRKCAIYSPTECDALKGIEGWQSVAIGQHHTLLLADYKVYALGRSEYGRLGLGEREGDAETPQLIPELSEHRCVSIACGTSNSFAVTDTGAVYAWGMGSEGQLGTGSESDMTRPTRVSLPLDAQHVATSVAAGGQHTTVCTENKSRKQSPSPTPEQETSEQKTDKKVEEEPKKERKPNKRQKKQEAEESEVSSTSTAAEVAADKPQKVNGNEKEETAMEVDEADNTQIEVDKAPSTDEKQSEATNKQATPEKSDQQENTQTHNEQTDETKHSDVDMKEPEAEVNGVPETKDEGKLADKMADKPEATKEETLNADKVVEEAKA